MDDLITQLTLTLASDLPPLLVLAQTEQSDGIHISHGMARLIKNLARDLGVVINEHVRDMMTEHERSYKHTSHSDDY